MQEPESLQVRHRAGVEMIIAIDSTSRGPALGGCRWRACPDSASARREVLALARAMTCKAALARLNLGGGKALVRASPEGPTRDQLLAFGDFVESLGGRYITAADMGTGEREMAVIAERTRHVVGLPRDAGGCGDPGPFTAQGVLLAIQRALEHRDRSLSGARVAVQGVGHVGRTLVCHLLAEGARVAAADVDPRALMALPSEVERVASGSILTQRCDVLAPCGPARVIDAAVARALRCSVVCGAANNPVSGIEVAREIESRGILYVPDFLSNAGGLIHLAVALEGGDAAQSRRQLGVIPENLDAVIAQAKTDGTDLASSAERIALSRVSSPASSG